MKKALLGLSNRVKDNKELKTFFTKLNQYDHTKIISIDETSLKGGLSQNYAYCNLGKRCIIKTDDNEVFKKYSLVVAINNKKCIDYKLYEQGAVNSIRFNDFLLEICKNVKNKLFILDNGQIHKKEETKKIIKDSSNFVIYNSLSSTS
jgi:phosphatidylserine/phosphatidylglycerophosphate/cardiolipin synthase-like enzyme